MANKEIREIEIKVNAESAVGAKKKIEELNKAFDRAMAKEKQIEAQRARIANRSRVGYGSSYEKGVRVAAPSKKMILMAKQYHENSDYFKMMERKFKAKQTILSRDFKKSRYDKGMGYHQNTPQFKNMETIFNAAMSSNLEPKFRHKFLDVQRHEAGLGYHQNTAQFKRMAQKFEQEKSFIEQGKVGRAFITNEKTSSFIENNVITKKNDALIEMKKYYEALERKTKKERDDIEKGYSQVWNEASAERLRKGKWQSESIKARGRNSMKAYKDRVRKQNESYRKSKKYLYDFPITFRNDLGNMSQIVTQAIGELTMFAGAITMVGFMASSAFQKIMATGDMFATTESKFLVGAGYREHLIKTGGIPLVAQFDRATELQSKLTGQNRFTAAQNLARAGNELKSMGGSVSESSLSNIAIASAGLAAVTGETSEKMMSKVLAVAKKGKDADKIGLGQLKLTKNMNENLEIIAKATKENPIAKTAINKGTVGVAMTRVRESFGALSGEVFGRHTEQIRTAFTNIGKAFEKGLGDPKSIYAWERTLTNLTNMTNAVFTPERITRMSENAAAFSADLIAAAGNLFVTIDWFLENKDSVISAVKTFAGIWATITALKIGVGLYKLSMDLINIYKAAKTVLAATSTAGTAGVAKGFGMLGLSRKLALPLAFLLTHKELGANEDKMLADYNLRKSLDKSGLSIYDQLNLRNGVAHTRNALDASLSQNDFGLSGVGYKDSGRVNQPMPSWQFPNANYIVVNGDVNMDGSTLSISDRWMQEGAGTI